VRLFVALRPPREALADLESRLPQWPGAPERWHLTLAFLGDVPAVEPVDAELAAELAGAPAPELVLAGSGTFGRTVWVGLDGELDRLQELARRVSSAVRRAGVPLERRRYRPHLTVGRGGRPDPARLSGYRGPAWTAREVELVRSDLGRTVTHTVLARYPLTSPSPGPGP
jgi:2'-5' RNA ligase